jgi:hypothetical protein
VLTPGRYVGAEAQADDGEPFAEKMQRLTATLREQMAEARKLDAAIEANLRELGYGGFQFYSISLACCGQSSGDSERRRRIRKNADSARLLPPSRNAG